jgi:hypothetical protein
MRPFVSSSNCPQSLAAEAAGFNARTLPRGQPRVNYPSASDLLGRDVGQLLGSPGVVFLDPNVSEK